VADLTVTTSDVVKTYNGALGVAGATVAPVAIVSGSATRLFGNDTLSGGSYAFTDANAGTGNRTVTVGNVTVNDGFAGGNYNVSYADNTTSTINRKLLTVTAESQTKVYDAGTSVTSSALGTGYSVAGLVGSESLSAVTLAYDSKDAGTRTITASNAVAGNNTLLSNYNVQYASNAVSSITPFIVSLDGGRVYNATRDVAAGALTIGTLVNGEQLTLSGTGTLTGTKDVGDDKAFDINTLALGNGTGLASNYTLVGGGRTATITVATISTVSGITATDKTYNANDAATLVTSGATFNGMFANDVLNVATSTGVFNDARAAIGKTVSISGITLGGTDAGNYTLTTSTASTTATINPYAVTVTALSQTKAYDATTAVTSSALGTGYSVSAMVGSESLSGVTLAYTNANVSRDGSGTVLSNKTIAVSAAQATAGTVLSDYAISYVNNTASTITPYVVSLTGGRVYDATTDVAAADLRVGTLINQETLGLAGSGTLGDKNVGQNKAVGLGTLNLTSGTGLASNYTLVDGGRQELLVINGAVSVDVRHGQDPAQLRLRD
jgi:hypothetical protein